MADARRLRVEQGDFERVVEELRDSVARKSIGVDSPSGEDGREPSCEDERKSSSEDLTPFEFMEKLNEVIHEALSFKPDPREDKRTDALTQAARRLRIRDQIIRRRLALTKAQSLIIDPHDDQFELRLKAWQTRLARTAAQSSLESFKSLRQRAPRAEHQGNWRLLIDPHDDQRFTEFLTKATRPMQVEIVAVLDLVQRDWAHVVGSDMVRWSGSDTEVLYAGLFVGLLFDIDVPAKAIKLVAVVARADSEQVAQQ